MAAQLTLKDIARALGLSASTVSRALKNNWDISEPTRLRVQQYAREHHYVPNLLASNLRASRLQPSHIIGVIVPQFTHYYFSCILTGIENVARAHGYTLMVAQSDEKYSTECDIVRQFSEARVCGLIVSQAKDTKDYAHFQSLIDSHVPVIFYDRICTGLLTSRVVVDDYAGAFTAVDYLIKTGCRRIAFYCADMRLEISKNRCNGYRDALRAHHLPVEEDYIRICDNLAQAEELTPYMLQLHPSPDAFFAINDETAVGIMNTCKRWGLLIPDDVSICGFTNSHLTRACDPQLTSVEQRGNEVGEAAANILMDKLEGRIAEGEIRNKMIKTKLIVRGSTKRIIGQHG